MLTEQKQKILSNKGKNRKLKWKKDLYYDFKRKHNHKFQNRYDRKLVLKHIEDKKISKKKERGSNNGIYL